MGIAEDLGKGLQGLQEALGGVAKVASAVDAVADQAGGIVDHLTDEETLTRIAQAGLGAAVMAAGAEIQNAPARPRPAPGAAAPAPPPPQARVQDRGPRPPEPAPKGEIGMFPCKRHGIHRWAHTIVCTCCGRVYQLENSQMPRYAPAACECGVRLLPPAKPDGQPFSGEQICSVCYVDIVADGGIAQRGARRGS